MSRVQVPSLTRDALCLVALRGRLPPGPGFVIMLGGRAPQTPHGAMVLVGRSVACRLLRLRGFAPSSVGVFGSLWVWRVGGWYRCRLSRPRWVGRQKSANACQAALGRIASTDSRASPLAKPCADHAGSTGSLMPRPALGRSGIRAGRPTSTPYSSPCRPAPATTAILHAACPPTHMGQSAMAKPISRTTPCVARSGAGWQPCQRRLPKPVRYPFRVERQSGQCCFPSAPPCAG